MSHSSPAYSQHHSVHYMTTVKGWAQLYAVELRSFQGSCSSLVPGVLLQAESIFAKLKLDVEPFELDPLAVLCSCSPQCFLSNVDSWKKEQWFLQCFQHRAFAPQNIDTHSFIILWYIQCPDGWCPVLQRYCKWFVQFYWQQSCCGWQLWVLFLKVTQAFQRKGISWYFLDISAWVPPWLCRDGDSSSAKSSLIAVHAPVDLGINWHFHVLVLVLNSSILRWVCGLRFASAECAYSALH